MIFENNNVYILSSLWTRKTNKKKGKNEREDDTTKKTGIGGEKKSLKTDIDTNIAPHESCCTKGTIETKAKKRYYDLQRW